MGRQPELNLAVLYYLFFFSSYPVGGSGPLLASHTALCFPQLQILTHKGPKFCISLKMVKRTEGYLGSERLEK